MPNKADVNLRSVKQEQFQVEVYLNIIHSMKINFLIKINHLGFILDKFIAVVKKETLKRDKNHLKVIHGFFFVYKNVVFPARAEYSYFSADVRLKIFL